METQLQLIPNEVPEAFRCSVQLSSLPDDSSLHSPTPDAAFIESVRRFGVLQPIILERNPPVGEQPFGFIVRAGRRRIKAARIAEIDEVEASIYDAGTFTTGAVELIENQQRSDNPISDLEAIETMLGRGASENQICGELGMNRLTLKRRLKLRGLIPELRRELLLGTIKPSTAEAASTLPENQQYDLMNEAGDSKRITHKHLHKIRSARAVEAFAALPAELFEPLPLPGGEAPPGGAQGGGPLSWPPDPPIGGGDAKQRLDDLIQELCVWRLSVHDGPQRPVKSAILERLNLLLEAYSPDCSGG